MGGLYTNIAENSSNEKDVRKSRQKGIVQGGLPDGFLSYL